MTGYIGTVDVNYFMRQDVSYLMQGWEQCKDAETFRKKFNYNEYCKLYKVPFEEQTERSVFKGIADVVSNIDWGNVNFSEIKAINANGDNDITYSEYCSFYKLSPEEQSTKLKYEKFAKDVAIVAGDFYWRDNLSYDEQTRSNEKLCSMVKTREGIDIETSKALDELPVMLNGAYFCRGEAFDEMVKAFLGNKKMIGDLKTSQIMMIFDELPYSYHEAFVESILTYNDNIAPRIMAGRILRKVLKDSSEYKRLLDIAIATKPSCMEEWINWEYGSSISDKCTEDNWMDGAKWMY